MCSHPSTTPPRPSPPVGSGRGHSQPPAHPRLLASRLSPPLPASPRLPPPLSASPRLSPPLSASPSLPYFPPISCFSARPSCFVCSVPLPTSPVCPFVASPPPVLSCLSSAVSTSPIPPSPPPAISSPAISSPAVSPSVFRGCNLRFGCFLATTPTGTV